MPACVLDSVQYALLPPAQFAFVLLAFGMSRADIAHWLDRFGAHADYLHDTLLRDLTPEILQLDELRAQIRGAKFVPCFGLPSIR